MDKNNWKCIVQIESTTHFHPQVASKAEKVFPIPLNRKTLISKFHFRGTSAKSENPNEFW